MSSRIAIIFVCAVLAGLCGYAFLGYTAAPLVPSFKKVQIVFASAEVTASVADTGPLRERGLSGTSPLLENAGMWFVFQEDGLLGFWMKEMNYPIDIIWFDSGFRAVTIKENAAPESYPEVFLPSAPARYVLEVPAGFARKNGIREKDSVVVHNIP